MSRSQPKAKIIYKNLNDLISKSSLSQQIRQCSLKKMTEPQKVKMKDQEVSYWDEKQTEKQLRENKLIRNCALERSVSKHSLKSKEKLNITKNFKESAVKLTHFKVIPGQDSDQKTYQQEIHQTHQDLELFFEHQKAKFLELLFNSMKSKKQQSFQINDTIGELQKMADYLKHIIKFYMECQGQSNTKLNFNILENGEQQEGNEKKKKEMSEWEPYVMKGRDESKQNNDMMAKMAYQHRKCKNERDLVKKRKKTIYEMILSRKGGF